MECSIVAPSFPVSAESVNIITKETLSALPWIFTDGIIAAFQHQVDTAAMPNSIPTTSSCPGVSLYDSLTHLRGNTSFNVTCDFVTTSFSDASFFNFPSTAAASDPSDSDSKIFFSTDFVPTINHVICGRGKRSYGHSGNKAFTIKVANSGIQDKYELANTKQEKTEIVQSIVDTVEITGGFIRLDIKAGLYYKAGGQAGREKTSQALRNCLNHKYKSSKEIKRKNRKEKRLAKKDTSSSNRMAAIATTGAHTSSSNQLSSPKILPSAVEGLIQDIRPGSTDTSPISLHRILKDQASSICQTSKQSTTVRDRFSDRKQHQWTPDDSGTTDTLCAISPSPALLRSCEQAHFRGVVHPLVSSMDPLSLDPLAVFPPTQTGPPQQQPPRSVSLVSSDRLRNKDAIQFAQLLCPSRQQPELDDDEALQIDSSALHDLMNLDDMDEMSELGDFDDLEVLLP